MIATVGTPGFPASVEGGYLNLAKFDFKQYDNSRCNIYGKAKGENGYNLTLSAINDIAILMPRVRHKMLALRDWR